MTTVKAQTNELAEMFAPWLDVIDEELAARDVDLPNRPLDALFKLLKLGVVKPHHGDRPVDLTDLVAIAGEAWFRALYLAVELWYKTNYGDAKLARKGNPPLVGAVLLRDAGLRLSVPNHRHKVEEPAKLTWMYFDDGIGNGEDPLQWVEDAPDLKHSDPGRYAALSKAAAEVATALRFIHFRRLGVANDGEAARGFVDAASHYLQQAAQKIVGGRPNERGPAWCDLQMAMESALKLVIVRATGRNFPTHKFAELLPPAAAHGVDFDPRRLAGWPPFPEISDNRYVQGDVGDAAELYAAYRVALDLVVAAMTTVEPVINAGAGLLLSFPPWLSDDVFDRATNKVAEGDGG